MSVGEQISLSDAVDDIQSESSILTNDDVSQTNEQLPTFIPPSIDLTKQRLAFILDVKSHQRHIYKTDQFNVRTGLFNGRIARIQGIKDESQKMLQILPKLQVSVHRSTFISMNSFFYRFQKKLFTQMSLYSLQ